MIWNRHFRAGLHLLGGLAFLLTSGCDGDVPSAVPVTDVRGSANPRGSQRLGDSVALPTPGQDDPNRERSAPLPRQIANVRPSLPSSPGAPAGAPAPGAAGDTTEMAPDYGNALRIAFGTPTACISAETREGLSGTLEVRVNVRATPTGRVTSATVSATGLSSTDTACMTERAEGLRLGPIEGAPRTVSTVITFDIASTPSTQTEAERPEWQTPTGAQAPGSVLSAGGTEGRPPGFVPPSSTLPATR